MNANDIDIEEPCHENWDAMSGRGKQRFCGSCTKHVHDFSKMTQVEVTTLLKTEVSPCVRYSADASGAVQFRKEKPVAKSIRRPRRRGKRAMLFGAAMMMASPAMASAVQAEDAGPSLFEELVEQVREWWAGEPVGCAGPGLVDPLDNPDTSYPQPPAMGMMVLVDPEPIPELVTVKGEVMAQPAHEVIPEVVPEKKPRKTMGKVRRTNWQ